MPVKDTIRPLMTKILQVRGFLNSRCVPMNSWPIKLISERGRNGATLSKSPNINLQFTSFQCFGVCIFYGPDVHSLAVVTP